jgi:hypothetical protein
MVLLQKVLKYKLHNKQKKWIQNLALEAETAISKLPASDRDEYRKSVAERVNTVQHNNNPDSNHSRHSEAKTLKTMKTKRQQCNDNKNRQRQLSNYPTHPTVRLQNTRLYTGKRLQHQHHKPHQNFPNPNQENNKGSKLLIPQETRRKYINLNPSTPTIKGLIKINEPDQTIRPVVNWLCAPAYNLVRLFTHKNRQLTPLPNA